MKVLYFTSMESELPTSFFDSDLLKYDGTLLTGWFEFIVSSVSQDSDY